MTYVRFSNMNNWDVADISALRQHFLLTLLHIAKQPTQLMVHVSSEIATV